MLFSVEEPVNQCRSTCSYPDKCPVEHPDAELLGGAKLPEDLWLPREPLGMEVAALYRSQERCFRAAPP